ncbi:CpsD/CapB family tyrosine-protein kinase [Desulfosporosinus meridiei]|uniref:Capsular exopolysaccharide biosynthesis protein n=1 Tax=Desulfosporosinus meridiei (strain ATCC BAA-275 / DSM 13257 / KCTC 12902 / NCIMB 13706 / S10) TaxID=768704 RepID=J7J3X0_DESMD|nr:CpsD/CapB family tyrosine-protein kinase [Desulfosporosinus meridiei]AFQ45968.1 capsular exopolysaccharide biosynthesis protein [Desulfosporosinus meridiei DSM 13257]
MGTKTFYVYDHENQAVHDAYAMLTANILISNDQKPLKTICISSCSPEEGKTSLAIGVAISMAQSGWRVLLVDADMRKPAAAKRMNQGLNVGLSNYLMGDVELTDALSETNIRNFTYFSCGNAHPNPIELLCSTNFKILMANVRNAYDIVIFDTPALMSVGDGAVVASNVDAALLVVRMGSTTLKCLKRVKVQLEDSNVQILGVVLNRVKKRDYKKYFGSYNYFFNAKRFYNNIAPPQNAAKL